MKRKENISDLFPDDLLQASIDHATEKDRLQEEMQVMQEQTAVAKEINSLQKQANKEINTMKTSIGEFHTTLNDIASNGLPQKVRERIEQCLNEAAQKAVENMEKEIKRIKEKILENNVYVPAEIFVGMIVVIVFLTMFYCFMIYQNCMHLQDDTVWGFIALFGGIILFFIALLIWLRRR